MKETRPAQRAIWALASSVLILLACNLPFAGGILNPAAGPIPAATSDPLATATATAFSPLDPTATPPPLPSPTPLPTFDPARPWGDFPAPSEPSAIDIPPPAPRIEFAENVLNIALLGSDARPYTGGYRTDVVMIVSLDPNKGTATLLSIPRDLYLYQPGFRVDRINTAEPRGGFDLFYLTVLYNFGIPVHHWGRINFGGFISLVDSMGGVDVQVGQYLNDKCGDNWYTFSPGVRHMDGWTAHCYVRMRKASSDFDRLRRQQEVIEAIFRKVISLDGLSRVPDLYTQFNRMLQTDLTVNDALPLIPLAAQLSQDTSRIRRFTIDPAMATGYRVPYSGASVLLPNWEAIYAMLRTAFGP